MSLNIIEMVPIHRRTKAAKALVSVFSAVPPILLAGIFRCLGTIIDLTSLCAYVLMGTPALCCYKATLLCRKHFGGKKCHASTIFSQPWMMIALIVVNAIGFCLTTYSLIYGIVA